MPITFVNANSLGGQDGGDTTIAVTLTGVIAGNFLAVAVTWDIGGATAVTGVVGNSNTYLEATGAAFTVTSNSERSNLWYVENANAGDTTITATFDGNATFRRIAVGQYSGVRKSGSRQVANGSNSSQGTGVTSINSGAVTPASDGCLIVGIAQYPGATLTPGVGINLRADPGEGVLLDIIQAYAAVVSINGTLSGGVNAGASAQVFQPEEFQPRDRNRTQEQSAKRTPRRRRTAFGAIVRPTLEEVAVFGR